jgi:hypothetical protein
LRDLHDDVPRFDRIWYFVTTRRVGATVLVGAIGEIEKVSQAFQPADYCFNLMPCSVL